MSEALAPSLRVRPATVAVVGRPNVGKSALFNRLLGQRLAIVEDTPGVTRDRLYALAEWRGRTFTLVDTGGIDTEPPDPDDPIAQGTRAQAESAARDADVIVFVVDAQDGLTPLDQDVAQILRRTRKPVILVANKIESPKHAASVHAEFGGVGFGEVYGVSALHGEGTGDLLDAIVEPLAARRSDRSRRDGAVHRADRAPERRQVVAAQRAAERRARDRVRRSGHDARRDRHAVHLERAPLPPDRHRGRAQTARPPRLDRVLLLAALAQGDRAQRHRDPADRRAHRPDEPGPPARRHRARRAQSADHRRQQVRPRARAGRVLAARARRRRSTRSCRSRRSRR